MKCPLELDNIIRGYTLTLCILEPLKGYFDSEDPDEMQHNAAFHQGLHCLLRLKQSSGREVHHNLENST